MKVLAVIPARGGSKGVSRKNVKLLAGKPLIAYSIEAAKAAARVNRLIVSTDDEAMAVVARQLGADVPWMRPPELATDSARQLHVVQHALRAMEETDGCRYDVALLLQPTAPLRTTADIDGALELLERTGADSVISVVDVLAHHPARMKYLDGDKLIDPPFCEAHENQARQELRPMYIRNGCIYATRRDVLLADSFKGKDCRAWIMPPERSLNIDVPEDFEYGEWLIARGHK